MKAMTSSIVGFYSKVMASTARIEPEITGLVRTMIVIEHPRSPITPEVRHLLGDPRNRPRVFFVRAEVVGIGKSRRAWRSGKQLFCKTHVPVQRFENMLPRTNGMRTANPYRLT